MARRLFILGSVALACAAPPPAPLAPAPPAPPSQEISEAELRGHVAALAADTMAGRGTLEAGEMVAARYLAGEFRALGLEPAPGQDFLVDATLRSRAIDSRATRAALIIDGKRHELVSGSDFRPFWFSKSGALRADVVFAGYGISNPKLGYDDFEGLDVSGKIVFVLRRAPKVNDGDKRFDQTVDALFTTKAAQAKKHGALGMILVTDPRSLDGQSKDEDLRLEPLLALPAKLEGSTWLDIRGFFARLLGAGDSPAIHSIHVRARIGELLGALLPQKNLLQTQKLLDQGKVKPASLGFSKRVELDVSVGAAGLARKVAATNVVGVLLGRDPSVRAQWIVVGAHYDHLGRYDGDGDTVYNGADDNASGTAAMLAIARRLAQAKERPRRSVVFVGFTAEEKGLLGSRVISRGLLGRDRVAFMVNMDMIGRNPERPVTAEGDGYTSGLKDMVERANADLGLTLSFGGESMSQNSDHHAFYLAGIPVLNLFTGLHDDYHSVLDHADKLDYGRMARIARLAERVTREIANADEVPPYWARSRWLGAAFEIEGLGEGGRATVADVIAGSTAAEAGLHIGDEIVALGDRTWFSRERIAELVDRTAPGTRLWLTIERRGQGRLQVPVHRIIPGFLGVQTAPPQKEESDRHQLSDGVGFVVTKVIEGGPAAKAGLAAGDIVVELDGQAVGYRSLFGALARRPAGSKVRLRLWRGEREKTVEVVLGRR